MNLTNEELLNTARIAMSQESNPALKMLLQLMIERIEALAPSQESKIRKHLE